MTVSVNKQQHKSIFENGAITIINLTDKERHDVTDKIHDWFFNDTYGALLSWKRKHNAIIVYDYDNDKELKLASEIHKEFPNATIFVNCNEQLNNKVI